MSEQRAAVLAAIVSCATHVCACGSPVPPAPQAPASLSVPLRLPAFALNVAEPETFRWRMKLSGLEVARFELRASVVANRVRLVSRGQMTGIARFFRTLHTQTATIIDRATGAAISSLAELRGQGRFRRIAHHFRAGGVSGTIGDANSSRGFARRSISGLAPLSSDSFLFAVRGWQPRRGDRALAVVIGEHNLWLLEVTAQAAAVIETPMGQRRARELRGVARRLAEQGTIDESSRPRQLRVFISDDATALPLRIEVRSRGRALLVELTDHIQH